METKVIENQYVIVTMGADGYVRIVQKSGGVVIAPYFNESYALIKHARGDEILLEFPRGFLESGESHLAGGERELKEELNVVAQDIELLGDLRTDSGLISDNVKAIRCKVKNLDTLMVQAEEGVLSCNLYSKDEIINAVRENKIKDNFTLSTLMLLIAKKYI
ncbi:NUDIX hydrolase [Dryocola sp. BD586]|uniref:NUDIX hydrolase n=1 Tax=Dryocola sp. BD586 TaxID=3133271 RepID=UPI003F50094E